MALSYQDYTGDGANKDFTFNKGYLSVSHVSLTVDGTPVTATLVGTTMTAAVAPATDTAVRVLRATPNVTPWVTWSDGSTVNEDDQNNSTLQALYLSQEAEDDVNNVMTLLSTSEWDAESHKIINLTDGVDDQDAATMANLDALAITTGNLPLADQEDGPFFLRGTDLDAGGAVAWWTLTTADIANFGADGRAMMVTNYASMVTLLSVPGLGLANTFSANQMIARSGSEPRLILRRTDTPSAPRDNSNSIDFDETDDGGTLVVGAGTIAMDMDVDTAAATSHTMRFLTKQAGGAISRMWLRAGMWMKNATGEDKGAGSFNAKELYIEGDPVQRQFVHTRISMSGNDNVTWVAPADMTTITKIEIMMQNVDIDNATLTDKMLVRLGDGTVENSGYVSACSSNHPNLETSTIGFLFSDGDFVTGDSIYGKITLDLYHDSATVPSYVVSGTLYVKGDGFRRLGGKIALPATTVVDRVSVSLSGGGGTDTFDGGQMNVTFYGYAAVV